MVNRPTRSGPSTGATHTGLKNGLGVFGPNKQRPFHRWYPFVEGYSSELVERALGEPGPDGLVLDPFGGSGTTALAAAMLGRDSVFAEVNPYLAWIADVKINQSRAAGEISDGPVLLRKLAIELTRPLPAVDETHPFVVADRKRRNFPTGVAATVLSLLGLIDDSLEGALREVARLAVATSLVPASLMVRRTDLRRRVASDPSPVDVISAVAMRLREFADDIEEHASSLRGTATLIAGDVRSDWQGSADVGVVVTSPPYLNGTNYCRNTKLELLALGFMASEDELQGLRKASISAGINNVSKRRTSATVIDCVEPVAQELEQVAYDVRIPTLVRTYFSDMQIALTQVRKRTLTGAKMFFDIGDSRYCGVHVPTHELLATIAEDGGWDLLSQETLRTRRSYDGSQLTQVLLHFEAV